MPVTALLAVVSPNTAIAQMPIETVRATRSFGGAAKTEGSITSMALDPNESAASMHAWPL